MIRIPATLATFSHVPLQMCFPAAPMTIPCVGPFPEQSHRSTFFRRSVVVSLQQRALRQARSGSALADAVVTAKLAAQIPTVSIMISFLLQSLMSLSRLLSCEYVGSYHQPLP